MMTWVTSRITAGTPGSGGCGGLQVCGDHPSVAFQRVGDSAGISPGMGGAGWLDGKAG